MKKLITVIAASLFAFASFGQNSTSGSKTEMDKKMEKESKKSHDMDMLHYEMEDGQLMEVKEGNSMPLTRDVTLDDGSVLMKNGTLKKKDGSTKQIRDGECVYKDGDVEKSKLKKKIKEMKDDDEDGSDRK